VVAPHHDGRPQSLRLTCPESGSSTNPRLGAIYPDRILLVVTTTARRPSARRRAALRRRCQLHAEGLTEDLLATAPMRPGPCL